MRSDKSDTFDLSDYLRPIKARWWILVLIAAVAGAGTYYHFNRKPRSYVSSTNLFLQSTSALDTVLGGSGGGGDTDRSARNQALLLQTPAVAERAAKRLGYRGDPRGLLGLVSAAPSEGTDFLQVNGVGGDPRSSARVADAFASAYIDTRKADARAQSLEALKAARRRLAELPRTDSTQEQRTALSDQIQRLELFATLPTASARQIQPAGLGVAQGTDPKQAAMFAILLGLLLGGVIAYALDANDRRIKGIDDLGELYGHPVLVGVPRARKAVRGAAPTDGLAAPLTESFRALRTTLQMSATRAPAANGNGYGRKVQTILVTSAMPTEGKSTVARNLALAYLEAGLRVAVVDADLRNPQLSRSFAVKSSPGLTEVLAGDAAIADSLRTVEIETHGLHELVRAHHRQIQSAELLVDTANGTSKLTLASPDAAKELLLPKLSVLPSARPPSDPAALLSAGGLGQVLQELGQDHDIVIVDSSPLLAVADAASLVGIVDGVILVSRLHMTTVSAATQVRDMVERIPGAHIMGVVANDVRDRSGTYAYSYGY